MRRSSLLHPLVATVEVKQKGGRSGFTSDVVPQKDIVPDHIEPKGMGGAWRDDSPENIQAVHRRCNLQERSKRLTPQ